MWRRNLCIEKWTLLVNRTGELLLYDNAKFCPREHIIAISIEVLTHPLTHLPLFHPSSFLGYFDIFSRENSVLKYEEDKNWCRVCFCLHQNRKYFMLDDTAVYQFGLCYRLWGGIFARLNIAIETKEACLLSIFKCDSTYFSRCNRGKLILLLTIMDKLPLFLVLKNLKKMLTTRKNKRTNQCRWQGSKNSQLIRHQIHEQTLLSNISGLQTYSDKTLVTV